MSLHLKPFRHQKVLKSAHPQLKGAQIRFFKVNFIHLIFLLREHRKDFDPLKNLLKNQTTAKIPFTLTQISKLNVSCKQNSHQNTHLMILFSLFTFPEGELDSVYVTSHELERLEPKIWLNDTNIDFELKYPI